MPYYKISKFKQQKEKIKTITLRRITQAYLRDFMKKHLLIQKYFPYIYCATKILRKNRAIYYFQDIYIYFDRYKCMETAQIRFL